MLFTISNMTMISLRMTVISATITFAALLSGCGPGAADAVVHLAGKYYYISTSSIYGIIAPKVQEPGVPYVPTKVTAYEYTSEFILAFQQDVTVVKGSERGYTLGEGRFWIVAVKDEQVIGPLSLSEFMRYCGDLRVPPKLQGKLIVKTTAIQKPGK